VLANLRKRHFEKIEATVQVSDSVGLAHSLKRASMAPLKSKAAKAGNFDLYQGWKLGRTVMSAFNRNPACSHSQAMSALPPKAAKDCWDVCFGPKADVAGMGNADP
jgi:hypothetical protein